MCNTSPDWVLGELHAMEVALSRLQALAAGAQPCPPSQEAVAAAALYLANLYRGAERLLEALLRARGTPLPSGPRWHAELLQEAAEPGRSAVLDERTAARLKEYLGFRHVVLHGYAHTPSWERMLPLVEDAPGVFGDLIARVRAWLSQGEPERGPDA